MQCSNPVNCYFHLDANGLYSGSPCFFVPNFKTRQEEREWHEHYTEQCQIGCGLCPQCVARKRASVDIRLKAELVNQIQDSSFITLTYDSIHIPPNGGLNYPDVSNFISSIRHWLKRNKPSVKFTWCRAGELGSKTKRPHYHLIFFGLDVLSIKDFGPSQHVQGDLYDSSFVRHFWPFGYNWTATAHPRCCSYVCGYSIKKLVADEQQYREERLLSDACTKIRKHDYLNYYDIHTRDISLDTALLSDRLKEYENEKYYTIYYKDAYNRWKMRKIINTQFPLGRCYHLGQLFYPAEQVRVSKHMGLEYFKQNLECIKFGYISDPFDIRIKRTLPVSYLNYLKNNNEGAYVEYKRKCIEHIHDLRITDDRSDRQKIFKNFSYTIRPLDEENAPLDEEEENAFNLPF